MGPGGCILSGKGLQEGVRPEEMMGQIAPPPSLSALPPAVGSGNSPAPRGGSASLPPLGQPLPSFPAIWGGRGGKCSLQKQGPRELPLHLGVPEPCPRREAR